jgi:hypothetical protein
MVMNELESTLASALQAEADRTTLHLDTLGAAQRLEAGLDRIDRERRHRTWRTVLTVAAAAVLVAVGVYGVIKMNSETTITPAKTPSTTKAQPYPDNSGTVTPGTYQLELGRDAAGAAIHADLTFRDSWQDGNYPVLSDAGGTYGGVAVYRPTRLAAGSGCLGGRSSPNVAHTARQLAQRLARLPRSTVVQPPTPVVAFGLHAVHLRLRIDQHCGRGVYRVAWTSRGGHGISYGNTSKDVVIGFWVAGMGRTPVVVERWRQVGAPRSLVHQIARTSDSITFGTGD